MAIRQTYQNTDANLTKIEQLSRDGLTYKAIAALMGFAESSFYELKRKYPALEYALKKGRADRLTELAAELKRRTEDKDDNGSALFFSLKTQHGFSEREGVRVSFPKISDTDTPETIISKLVKAFDDPDINLGADSAAKIGTLVKSLHDIRDVKELQEQNKILQEQMTDVLNRLQADKK